VQAWSLVANRDSGSSRIKIMSLLLDPPRAILSPFAAASWFSTGRQARGGDRVEPLNAASNGSGGSRVVPGATIEQRVTHCVYSMTDLRALSASIC